MFARISQVFLFAIFALPILAAASAIDPSALAARGIGNQCNVGTVQCCNSVQQANSPAVSLLTGLLGIVLGAVTGQVGLTCSPIDVIGISGNSCSAQPVCCTGNNFSGLIVVGCTPINLNL